MIIDPTPPLVYQGFQAIQFFLGHIRFAGPWGQFQGPKMIFLLKAQKYTCCTNSCRSRCLDYNGIQFFEIGPKITELQSSKLGHLVHFLTRSGPKHGQIQFLEQNFFLVISRYKAHIMSDLYVFSSKNIFLISKKPLKKSLNCKYLSF